MSATRTYFHVQQWLTRSALRLTARHSRTDGFAADYLAASIAGPERLSRVLVATYAGGIRAAKISHQRRLARQLRRAGGNRIAWHETVSLQSEAPR